MLSSLEIQNVPVLAEILNAGIDRRDKDDDADDEIERVGAGHGHHQDQADHRAGRLDLAAPTSGNDAPVAASDDAAIVKSKVIRLNMSLPSESFHILLFN